MPTIISGGAIQQVRPSGGGFPLPVGPEMLRHRPSGTIATIGPLVRHITYEGMYRTQPWVWTVINKLVFGLARQPLKTYAFDVDGDARMRLRAGQHPLATLMKRPRPGTRTWHMKVDIAWSLFVHGHAFFVKGRPAPGQPPDSLWPVPWPQVQPISDDTGTIGWVVHLLSGSYGLGVDDVLHFELPGGVSPLEPLRSSLRIEEASQRWQESLFANSAVPRGAFTTDGRIRDEAMPRLRAELESLYVGAENAGRFGLFDQGLKWQQISASAVDAELINQRKLTREEVCAVYDVSPPLVGILDRATFNNIDTLHTALYVDTLGPRATLIEETFGAGLIDPELAWRDTVWVEFDPNDVLRPDPEKRYRAYLMGQQSSTSTINERRRAENQPPIDHPLADSVLLPTNMAALTGDGVTTFGVDEGGIAAEGATQVDAAALALAAFTAGSGDGPPSIDPDEED